MNNFFEGLEILGFKDLDHLTIFEEKQDTQDTTVAEKKNLQKQTAFMTNPILVPFVL